jgi:hypothetical protein
VKHPIGYTVETEFPAEVAVVDRAHHVKFIARIIEGFEVKDPTKKKPYPETFLLDRKDDVKWNLKTTKEILKIQEIVGKFRKREWFYPLVKAVVQDAYDLYLQEAPSDPDGRPKEVIYTRVLQRHLRSIVLKLADTLWPDNPRNFKKLFKKSYFSNLDHYRNTQLQTSTEAFIDRFGCTLTELTEDEAAGIVSLLFFVSEEYRTQDMLRHLCTNPTAFDQDLVDMIQARESNLHDFKDIDTIDFNSPEFANAERLEREFAHKVRTNYHYAPENLVVLNTNPGALCAYNKIAELGCARHCLKRYNIEGRGGDNEYLVLIGLFAEAYPQFRHLFRITTATDPSTGIDSIKEIAFPIKMFKEKVFRDTIIDFAEKSELHHSLSPKYSKNYKIKLLSEKSAEEQ